VEEARRIAVRKGVTHVLIKPGPDTALKFYYIKHGNFDESGMQQTFAGRLVIRSKGLPGWIQRDETLEQALQPGYLFLGKHYIADPYMIFRINQNDERAQSGNAE
jgi:hypothetical protein